MSHINWLFRQYAVRELLPSDVSHSLELHAGTRESHAPPTLSQTPHAALAQQLQTCFAALEMKQSEFLIGTYDNPAISL